MNFRVTTKEPESANSATAIAEPNESTVGISALLAKLIEGYRKADGLRKRREELKARLPELSQKASSIAKQRAVLEVIGKNANAKISEATAPLLAAKREIVEIPTKIKAIGNELRTEVEQTRLEVLNSLRSKYLTRVDETPVGKIETLLRAAHAEADALDPVLRRWSGYVTDFAWQPIDTSLRPAVMTGRWQAALADLAAFRARLK